MDSPPPTLPRTPVKRAASAAFSDQPETSPILTHHHSHPNLSDISSDTSGSVPGSPMEAEELEHAEQVTMCKWDGCDMDMGNMDDLVKHIHDEHIGLRRAKYACEWDDCNRKGMAHASGYALRAHMRSHTKEKPFYCTLPGKQALFFFPSAHCTICDGDANALDNNNRMRQILHPLRRSR